MKGGSGNEIPSEYREGNPFARKWDYSWIDKPWNKTGSEKYALFRQQIDVLAKKEATAAQQLIGIARMEREKGRKSPWDPLIQFRFAYAAYMAYQVTGDSAIYNKVGMTELMDRFRIIHFPGEAEYARAFFLNDDIPMPQPIRRKLGQRLYRMNSDDRRVLYVLIQTTNPSISQEERLDAIRLADELVEKWPNYAKAYAVRAGVFDRSFFSDHHRKDDARMAIQYYKEYLEHAPVSAPWRTTAAEQIKYIESELKKP